MKSLNSLDVRKALHSTNVTIHERVCVISPPYYLDWCENSYPNVTLNRDGGPFFLQITNGIQETKNIRTTMKSTP